VQRITRPALEDAKCGNPAAEQLIGSLALGCTVVIKTMMKHEFFLQLTSVRIEDLDVFQSLKSKFTADIIYIPTLQKFSNSIDSLCQVYLLCLEDTLYDAFGVLIDFMTQTKGKAFLTNIESDYNFAVADSSPIDIPVETIFSNQSVLGVKKLASETDNGNEGGQPSFKRARYDPRPFAPVHPQAAARQDVARFNVGSRGQPYMRMYSQPMPQRWSRPPPYDFYNLEPDYCMPLPEWSPYQDPAAGYGGALPFTGMMPEYYSSMYNGAMASFPPPHDPAAAVASSRFQYYYPRNYEQMAYPLQQPMAAINLDPHFAFPPRHIPSAYDNNFQNYSVYQAPGVDDYNPYLRYPAEAYYFDTLENYPAFPEQMPMLPDHINTNYSSGMFPPGGDSVPGGQQKSAESDANGTQGV
jgi:hypothetical protein